MGSRIQFLTVSPEIWTLNSSEPPLWIPQSDLPETAYSARREKEKFKLHEFSKPLFNSTQASCLWWIALIRGEIQAYSQPQEVSKEADKHLE